jgi:hypothetical protein
MSEYNFEGLTRAQMTLLTYQGWWQSDKGHRPRPNVNTVEGLMRRNLLIEHARGNPPIYEYEVPTDVHMAWCAYCSVR